MATNDKGEEAVKHDLGLSGDIKAHAQALGELVIVFSSLELNISYLLSVMLRIEFTRTGDVVTGGIDITPKIRIIKSLGFILGKDMPNDWYGRLCTLLQTIESRLCPMRNRMIHDFWGVSEQPEQPRTVLRITLKPRISKQPVELKRERISVSVLDINALSYEVVGATEAIMLLTFELHASLLSKYPLRSPRPK